MRSILRSRVASRALAGALVSIAIGAAFAPPPRDADAQPIATEPARAATSLKTRFGIEGGRLMLSSRDPSERAAGVERLGTSENPQAIDALIDALDRLEKAEMLEARLMAVRVLRDHVDRAEVRDFLVKELMATTQSTRAATLGTLLRASAALALARWGDAPCVDALFDAIASRGPAVEAAKAALLAYPPRSLDVVFFTPDTSIEDVEPEEEDLRDVVDKKSSPKKADPPNSKDAPKSRPKKEEAADPKGAEASSGGVVAPKGMKLRTLHANVVEFLGDLGDLRAVPVLRSIARGESATRPAAGLALAKFGDDTSFGDARRWAQSDDVKLAETGARILVSLDDWSEEKPGEGAAEKKPPPKLVPKNKAASAAPVITVKGPPAVKAVARLLSSSATRRAGFQLILDARSPSHFAPLVEALGAIAHEPTGDDRSLAVLALGRVQGASAIVPLLDDAAIDRIAAFALATMPGDDATAALSKAIGGAKTPAKTRLVVRAGVVRAVALGSAPPGLEDALAALEKSKEAVDVDTVAFARVALGADVGSLLGKAPSAPLLAGAARAAPLRGRDALLALVPFLAGADDGQAPTDQHVAAGIALLLPEGRAAAPQQTLLAWAEGGGALAPLAALALPSHDDDAIRPRIKTLLLEGTDPLVRAHVAFGLADDPEPSSVSLLSEAYLVETNPVVRRAIVRAIAARAESQRTRILAWAADLDPDEANRSIAKLALNGVVPKASDGLGLTISWTTVTTTDGTPRALPARILRGDDYAISVLTAPDGDLLVPVPPYGTSALTVYASPVEDAAPDAAGKSAPPEKATPPDKATAPSPEGKPK